MKINCNVLKYFPCRGWILFFSLALFNGCNLSFNNESVFYSPDGQVRIELIRDREKELFYSVFFQEKEIIHHSKLGIELQGNNAISSNLFVIDYVKDTIDEDYTLVAGKMKNAKNYCYQYTVNVRELTSPPRMLHLVFRAYNDGVAFRYVVPEQKNIENYNVVKELTEFRFTEQIECWPLFLGSFKNNYENPFFQGTLQDISEKSLVGLPLTFKTKGMAGAITEACLKDYSGMYLKKTSRDSLFLYTTLSPHPENSEIAVISDKGVASPWRVIMLAKDELQLMSSNIITNLNDSSVIGDVSWIKPGKSAWDWWNYQTVTGKWFKGAMDNRTMQYFIDFASEFNLEYMLIDAGWYGDHYDTLADITQSIPEIDIPALVQYGKEKNVGIMLWVNWRNIDTQMEKALEQYEKWGIAGIKIDYMNADHQPMVAFYHRICRETAKHRLMLNLHGAYKPTGIRRTYPNLMTREGIYGLEQYRWTNKSGPEHELTIPFTRMLVGPMDFTPGGFNNVSRDKYIQYNQPPTVFGTRCHQLAMYVVYDSPLQMVADHPGAYRFQPGSDFLKMVPATWDTSVPLQGIIGDYIVMARKSNDRWFLGAMTDWSPREIKVPLRFLQDSIQYQVTLYKDNPVLSATYPTFLVSEKIMLTAADTLTIPMVSGGGMAACFEQVKKE